MVKIYSTVFPVSKGRVVEDLAQTTKTWIAGSPHRKINEEELADIAQDGFRFEGDDFEIQTARHENGELLYGTRLIEKSTSAIRTTDIVGCKTDSLFDVSISHNYETIKIGEAVQGMSKPRIVNDIITDLGGAFDGRTLRVQKSPYMISEDDLEFVAEVVNNSSDNKLPVVYLSKERDKYLLADPNRLAFKLGGMAHVLVEPSKDFSHNLRRATNGRNCYNGAAAIYWPNGMSFFILPRDSNKPAYVLYDKVQEHSLFSITPKELTFDGILSRQSSDKLAELKSSKKVTVDEALGIAEDEIDRRDREINELKSKISSLEQKVIQQSRQSTTAGGQLLEVPEMTELYRGELQDIIIDALKSYSSGTVPDSRRYDMVMALIEKNQETGEKSEIVDAVNRVFKSASRKFTDAMAKDLRKLGFEVEHGSKHHHVYVPGNDGRRCTIPKTASDHRSMKNACSELKRKLL